MSHTDKYQEHQSYRQRSRDKHHNSYRGRSSSQESDRKKKKNTDQKTLQKQSKRVKFNTNIDVKIFKKQDQPNSKGLSETEVMDYMKKIESEKGASLYSMNWDSNWDNAKHRDAQLENNSIKQQKEKEKALNEKLLAMKQEMEYYSPNSLNLPVTEIKIEAPGYSSVEKEAHSVRLNDVLGCFYAHWKQIPAQPSFQIQNKSTKSTSQPKNISFDKLMFNDLQDLAINQKALQNQRKDGKPLKGILKLSPEDLKKEQQKETDPTKIDPNLINILREINLNKSFFTKQKTEALLKPYKQSGELDYLMKNPKLLNEILRGGSAPRNQPPSYPPNSSVPSYPPRHSISPQPSNPADGYRSDSAGRYGVPSSYPNMGNPNMGNPNPYNKNNYGNGYRQPYPPQYQNTPPYAPEGHSYGNPGFVNSSYTENRGANQGQTTQAQGNQSNPYINKNFRTVPCKYFHSVQGCVKGNNCTYIHDEQYAGRASPLMQKYGNNQTSGNRSYGDNRGQSSEQRGSEERNQGQHRNSMQGQNQRYDNNVGGPVPGGYQNPAMVSNYGRQQYQPPVYGYNGPNPGKGYPPGNYGNSYQSPYDRSEGK